MANSPPSIDREFHRLLYPKLQRLEPDPLHANKEDAKRAEWRQLRRERFDLVAARIKACGRVDPFKVWRDGERLIIVDGRHCEFSIASRLGLPIETVEVSLGSRAEAQSYMISECLLDKGRPRYCDYYRVILASKCDYILAFKRVAKAAQGRRSDLLALAPESQSFKTKPKNTRQQIASLTDVGETNVRKALEIGSLGELYFGKERFRDLENSLMLGLKSISNIHEKLKKYIGVAQKMVDAESEGIDLDSEDDDDQQSEPSEEGDADDDHADDEEGEGKLSEEAKEDARRRVKRRNAKGKAKQDNVAKRLTTFPFENPDLDALSWEKANRILCGNNAEVMARMPEGIAGLVFGSPPYPCPKDYEGGKSYDKALEAWLEEDIAPVVTESARVLREGGRLIIQCSDTYELDQSEDKAKARSKAFMPCGAEVVHLVRSMGLGLQFREIKVWQKAKYPHKEPLGSVGSPSDPKGRATAEWIIVFDKGNHTLSPPSENSPKGMTADFYRLMTQSVLYYAPSPSNKADHPCPFPPKLASDVIRYWSWHGDLVVDPWIGSGTTAAEAAKLGRRFIGIDCVDKYCRLANALAHEAQNERRKEVIRMKKTPPPAPEE